MDNISTLRLGMFVGVFALMALIEARWPARHDSLGRKVRWRANLLMVVCGALLARLILPATLAGVALYASEQQLGVLPMLAIPEVVAIIVGILLLDLAIYWQHRLFHRIPLLWRLHQVHHADSHVDSSTGLRFHPLEIGLSLFIKAAVILAFGIPVLAVIIFEIALNAFSIFNHTNIRLPQKLDDKLAWLVITQRLHRIHHSQHGRETNSNFGFSVSWWDRLFGSFKARARQPDEQLDIGQRAYPASRQNSAIGRLLLMPFGKLRN